MSSPFVGEIRMVGFTFAPRSWALCDGQTIAISQNTLLYAVIGTTYGGNGTSTFQLPNMQGRAPMHWGNSAGGIPATVIGETLGSENVTLTNANINAHSHPLNASNVDATLADPVAGVPAVGGQYTPTGADALLSTAVGTVGSATPVPVLQPLLVVNFLIATTGIFPEPN